MNRTFEKILNLTLQHEYYTSGFSNDFVIVPTAATKQLLKKHNLIFRNTTHGFFISCDNVTMATLSLILSEKTLHFILELKNNNFINFTALPPRPSGKHSYYLRCPQEGEVQEPIEAVSVCPPIFTYTFPAAGDTTSLQIEDSEGNVHIEETIAGSPGQQLNTSINLWGYKSGLYRFIVEGQPDENIYITDELPNTNSFGFAEITLPIGFDPQTSGTYQFQFNARTSVWEYHFLFSKSYQDHSFNIEDTLEGEIFTETEAPPNYDEGSQSTFASQNPILYQEGAKRGLQLVVTNPQSQSNTLIDHLPNPSVSNAESKVYLTI